METNSKDDKIFLGRGVGLKILHAIKNAKSSVKVVSPYLSPDYTKELVKLHNHGVEVMLITCDNIETNDWSDFKVSDIIKTERIENKRLKILKKNLYICSFALFIIALIMFLSFLFLEIQIFNYFTIALFALAIIIFGISFVIKEYDYTYHPIFPLKVFDSKSGKNPQSTNLIHSKIYLIDNKILYMGSANYTYSAFNTHYETVIEIKDPFAITEIDKEIQKIFDSKELKEKKLWEIVR